MPELLEILKTLAIQELHIGQYEHSVTFWAPWETDGNTTITLVAKTPQELTQAILRMTGGVDNV